MPTTLIGKLHKKFRWSPKKNRTLILDLKTASRLAEALKIKKFTILPIRREYIYIKCLIKAICKKLINKEVPLIYFYLQAAIIETKPRTILSFADSYPWNYALPRSPKIKTFIFQNGSHDQQTILRLGKSLKKIKKWLRPVDYIVVMNRRTKNLFKKLGIKGRVYCSGSILNNAVPLKRINKKRHIFISQFRKDLENKLGFRNFYKTEKEILPLIYKKEKKLLIMLAENSVQEKAFFSEILKNKKAIFLPKGDWKKTYQNIDSAKHVIHVDSTLGFEAQARGIKASTIGFRHNGAKGRAEDDKPVSVKKKIYKKILNKLKDDSTSLEEITSLNAVTSSKKYFYDSENKKIKQLLMSTSSVTHK